MSMWAQFLLGEKAENASIENYTDIREKYGISTLGNSQQNALKDLGITAQGFFGGKTHEHQHGFRNSMLRLVQNRWEHLSTFSVS